MDIAIIVALMFAVTFFTGKQAIKHEQKQCQESKAEVQWPQEGDKK